MIILLINSEELIPKSLRRRNIQLFATWDSVWIHYNIEYEVQLNVPGE